MICGLLGQKLSHSYSPDIHRLLGNYSYRLLEVSPEQIGELLSNHNFSGFNVTIPYKKTVIPFCDRLTPCAQKLGAVNTIVRDPGGKLIGHNTDYSGFRSMLEHSKMDLTGKKVLVLGSGGASATVQQVLKDLLVNPVVISRTGEYNYHNLHLHRDAAAIINTTPVGMYPNTGESPVDLNNFPCLEGVLDLIYNPARTALILEAEARGLVVENGLWMLVAQAVESAQWFTGHPISSSIINEIYAEIQKNTENIILVGMPGCGKTSVGCKLAERLGRTLIDVDSRIEEITGRSIPEIIMQEGEAAFRKIETDTIREIGKMSSLVIATGGGCVTRAENYSLLHQNGTIFWIQRDLSLLPLSGRPLSAKEGLETLYANRVSLYNSFSDYIVDNNQSIGDTCTQIIEKGAYL